jgi:hypothetical protein
MIDNKTDCHEHKTIFMTPLAKPKEGSGMLQATHIFSQKHRDTINGNRSMKVIKSENHIDIIISKTKHLSMKNLMNIFSSGHSTRNNQRKKSSVFVFIPAIKILKKYSDGLRKATCILPRSNNVVCIIHIGILAV